MVKSAYIHIPFCKSKCHYCSFISFCKFDLKKDYLNALLKEINYHYKGEILNTIYLGGGTPSVLEVSEIDSVLHILKFNNNTEITMECNPEDCDYDYFRKLYDIGVNRISLGCQSFDDNILISINRRHNAEKVELAVNEAQNAGFKNVSLDFIYGLPNQSTESFLNDLKHAVELGVQHISLYGLKLEEGCFFYNRLPKNLPDDDMQAQMYLEAIKLLTDSGFEHYEVSNFSLAGFNSKHNLTYWNNEEYYGFGVAAHGYKDGIRYSNKEEIELYVNDPLQHEEEHLLTEQERLEEEIFLGLRCMCGIDTSLINEKYHIDFETKYADILKKYESLNLLKRTTSGWAFTPEGILVSNVVLADFIEE